MGKTIMQESDLDKDYDAANDLSAQLLATLRDFAIAAQDKYKNTNPDLIILLGAAFYVSHICKNIIFKDPMGKFLELLQIVNKSSAIDLN